MRGIYLSLASVAIGLASANTYPNCEPDNCFRNLDDIRYADQVAPFCYKFLESHVTDYGAIPEEYSNCEGNIEAVSSACSCITYSHSTTATSTKTYPGTTTSVPVYTTKTYPPHITSVPVYTTSTIYATHVYTVKGCPAYVADCPAGHHVTTEYSVVSTTVCPVVYTPVVSLPVPVYHKNTTLVAPYTSIPKPTPYATTSAYHVQVTGAAGRTTGGLIAAAGAALAAFIL